MTLDDVDDGYRTVLNIVMRTTKQTQMLLPESQPSRSRIIPSVRQTMSKSPNLQFMRQSLECLYGEDKSEQVDQLADGMDISESKALAINSHDMAQQRALEFGAYQSAIEVWKHEMKEALKRGDVYTSRLGVRNLVWDWMEAMKVHLKAVIDKMRPNDVSVAGSPVRVALDRQMEAQRLDLAWLTALPLETMCAITIMEVLRVFMTEFQTPALKASTLCSTIGRCVEKEIAAQDMLRKENRGLLPKQFNLRQITAKKRLLKAYASKFHRQLISGTEGTSAWPYEWNSDVRVRVILVPQTRLTGSSRQQCYSRVSLKPLISKWRTRKNTARNKNKLPRPFTLPTPTKKATESVSSKQTAT
jgi:DNA-directed RNA polymerase